MNLTPFRCMIRLDERIVLVAQCIIHDDIFISRVHFNMLNLPKTNLFRIREHEIKDTVEYSEMSKQLKDAVFKFLRNCYKLDAVSPTVNEYFSLKRDLFSVLAAAESDKSANPDSDIEVYYRVMPDKNSREANFYITPAEISTFALAGEVK